MASRPIDLPSTHEKLAQSYAAHGSRRAVSKALGVDEKTIARWLKAIIASGLSDPRTALPVARPPKKNRKKPAAKRASKKDLAQ